MRVGQFCLFHCDRRPNPEIQQNNKNMPNKNCCYFFITLLQYLAYLGLRNAIDYISPSSMSVL